MVALSNFSMILILQRIPILGTIKKMSNQPSINKQIDKKIWNLVIYLRIIWMKYKIRNNISRKA